MVGAVLLAPARRMALRLQAEKGGAANPNQEIWEIRGALPPDVLREVAATDAQVTLVGACTAPDTFLPVVPTSKELTLQFVVYYRPRDFAQTLDFVSAGRLDPRPLITGHVTLDELPSRFTQLMTPNEDCKVLIHP